MNATKKTKAKAGSAFAGAITSLGDGVHSIFKQDGPLVSELPLDMIDVEAQVRTTFDDDEENTLKGLADSIKVYGLIQPVLVRPKSDGRYHLIAGERRYRASKLAGLSSITALIRDVEDEKVAVTQLQENIQRQNLAQLELAKAFKQDLIRLGGSLDKLAALHKKNKPYLSKMLGLLELPEQSRRLVHESISADLEVINTVKQVERKDKEAAQQLVDTLKATSGKKDARAIAKAAREEVEPPKKPKPAARKRDDRDTTVATAPDRRIEQPSGAKVSKGGVAVLGKVWAALESKKRPETILAQLDEDETDAMVTELRAPFNDGRKAEATAHAVLDGLRSGRFAPDGHGALILAAYLCGADAVSNEMPLDGILKAARL